MNISLQLSSKIAFPDYSNLIASNVKFPYSVTNDCYVVIEARFATIKVNGSTVADMYDGSSSNTGFASFFARVGDTVTVTAGSVALSWIYGLS